MSVSGIVKEATVSTTPAHTSSAYDCKQQGSVALRGKQQSAAVFYTRLLALPAASGIVAVATEVVCRITFSPTLSFLKP